MPVRTVLIALRSFFPSDPKGAVGALDSPDEVRKQLAKRSPKFKCHLCKETNLALLQRHTSDAADEDSDDDNDGGDDRSDHKDSGNHDGDDNSNDDDSECQDDTKSDTKHSSTGISTNGDALSTDVTPHSDTRDVDHKADTKHDDDDSLRRRLNTPQLSRERSAAIQSFVAQQGLQFENAMKASRREMCLSIWTVLLAAAVAILLFRKFAYRNPFDDPNV
jgi:hypothetical protein